MGIKIGPSGNSQSFYNVGYKATVDAPKYLKELGLNAFEYPCGRGVNIGSETARKIAIEAEKNGIQMSVHSPYFINLSSADINRVEKNIKYIFDSCRVAKDLDAKRIVVHCGGLGKLSRDKAMVNTKNNLKLILNEMENSGYSNKTLCIETMGKINVLGTLSEVCEIVRADDRLMPCIDFGHMNAATLGGYNTEESFVKLFDEMENKIGLEKTGNAHCHFSKIEYSKGGEVKIGRAHV